MADDINLDVPRFKAGDCLVYKAPMSDLSYAVKIIKLNKITFRGQTVHTYVVGDDTEEFSMPTWQFDVLGAKKFNCKDFLKVKVEIDTRNKAAIELQEQIEAERIEKERAEQEAEQKAEQERELHERAERRAEAQRQAEIRKAEEARRQEDLRKQEEARSQQERVRREADEALQTHINLGGAYWDKLEASIRTYWVAPSVDLSAISYEACVKFRFYEDGKNGKISNVEIKTTSGNSDFDAASLRAVTRARPQHLPSSLSYTGVEEYREVEMDFRLNSTR